MHCSDKFQRAEKDHTYKYSPEYPHAKIKTKYCEIRLFLDLSAPSTLQYFLYYEVFPVLSVLHPLKFEPEPQVNSCVTEAQSAPLDVMGV